MNMLLLFIASLLLHQAVGTSKAGLNCDESGKCQEEINRQSNVVCPDGTECPSGSTCCELASGKYGCCPYPNAVCCSDHLHCCPQGYTCDVTQKTCTLGSKISKIFQKKPATQINREGNVICPDKKSECPDGNTCCELESGGWGCCPIPNAVCCSDGEHCCPQGYTCDVATGTCTRGSKISKIFQKKPATEINRQSNVFCPDGSECPSGQTCCELASGKYGCCPHPNAVCCSDHLHCCPQGYTCDVTHETCIRGSKISKIFQKKPATEINRQSNIVCPGGEVQCPSRNTCCLLASGEYGCCPLPDAVCCSDGVHCCPNGYTCTQGSCTLGSKISKIFQKKPATEINRQSNIVCPGGEVQCPSRNTCCLLASGEYGCCPLPDAVCCSDGVHCCPNGYTCTQGSCTLGSKISKIFQKKPATEINRQSNIVCPGGEVQCPSRNTCCLLASGEYGCCPLPDAVCCSDGVHCCPNGYTCTQGSCTLGSKISKIFQKKPATEVNRQGSHVCPDGQSECPDGNTCCKLKSGKYGCCPIPKAVCCSDHVHCCPNGYTCDVTHERCIRGSKISKIFQKKPATEINRQSNVVCKGGEVQCPSGETCCLLASGEYGCCPFPNAVCCSDGEHCCPNGYTCDVAAGSCNRGSEISKIFKKKTATEINREGNVICPDDESECPDGNTCCRLKSGEWGCCPFPKAVCCSDRVHCCRNGYTCDVAAGTCNKGSEISKIFQKKTATEINQERNVV